MMMMGMMAMQCLAAALQPPHAQGQETKKVTRSTMKK